MLDRYIKRILTAQVYAVAIESALQPAAKLSERLGNEVLLKREDQQPVFSFKLRGAYNKIALLDADERSCGVICASAGNHAQGVALAAGKLGSKATIVMPITTPAIKVEAVRALGGEVLLEGLTYDEASDRAKTLSAESGLTLIPAFDDADVIAGQGTIGVEIARQCTTIPDAIFVPVGGGGLIAGVAVYIKHLYPDTKIIGVEPEESASMHAALKAGKPVTLDRVGIFADGVSVRRVGDESFSLCKEYVDEIILVSTDELCAAIKDIFLDTRAITEPAGALAVAGLKKKVAAEGWQGKSLVAINSGANMGFDRLKHVAERANLGEQTEGIFSVQIPEEKGAFLRFSKLLGARAVTEFNYRLSDANEAKIFVGVALQEGLRERDAIARELAEAGYGVLDLSENELAKTHIRHMVGGLMPGSDESERLIRFEFPERPGALLNFLESVGAVWNISLFHYRNHGSDYGRVLAGVQVPDAERSDFEAHLQKLGYPYWDETENPAYRLFLG
ncbi:MAG: threonine ammonia-lyase, biosynthetic [Kofleriaceae bacterium]|nr:threonine ammonia-lyase, biosynthetic [Kofleriaceae bacterium]